MVNNMVPDSTLFQMRMTEKKSRLRKVNGTVARDKSGERISPSKNLWIIKPGTMKSS
jgi:hypothetical protein